MTKQKKPAPKAKAKTKAKPKPAKAAKPAAKPAAKKTAPSAPAEKPLAYNVGPKTVTVFFDGRAHTVEKSTYLAAALRDKNWSEVKRLCSPARALANSAGFASGFVAVSPAGVVTYKNRPINNASARRIVELAREGFPVESELRCLESLMRHDDPRVIESFEDFLDRWHVPRLDDGRIVLVKAVAPTDKPDVFAALHDASFLYRVGAQVEMAWADVCRDENQTCAAGIHACPLSQVNSYWQSGRDGRTVIELHVWPEHIASLPRDYRSEGKVRLQSAFVARALAADAGESDLTGRA